MLALQSFSPPAAARESWSQLAEVLTALAGAKEWAGQIELVRRWYDHPVLEAVYDDVAARRNDLEQLDRIFSGYGSRQQFLTELTLDPPDATGAEAGVPFLEEDWLTLSTIHSAKGQE